MDILQVLEKNKFVGWREERVVSAKRGLVKFRRYNRGLQRGVAYKKIRIAQSGKLAVELMMELWKIPWRP